MSSFVQFCDFVSVSWLVNLVGRVVSILLEYVGQVSLCGKLTKVLEKHREWPHIHTTTREFSVQVQSESFLSLWYKLVFCDAGNPRSLSHLSRVVIRKHLNCSNVPSVHLPNRLKNYLLFTDNDLYTKIICRED